MKINRDIAKTYVFANKKLTAVAVAGVVLGLSIFIFMNCLVVGFDGVSYSSVFKTTSHIRLYKDDEISKPLINDTTQKYIIINPKLVPQNNRIVNPQAVIEQVSKNPLVKVVTPQVNANVFYNSGKSQIAGLGIGILPEQANLMYSLDESIVEGSWQSLKSDPSGILIGAGIARKLNLKVGDILNVSSSKNINKNFKVIGIFKTSNSKVDNANSYINLASAQQLLKERADYVSDININLYDFEKTKEASAQLSELTGYKAEGFEESNESLMAGNRMRKIVIQFISVTIMLVAGFGIYNILNMTVSQKINDIAILKAMGFKGKDVIEIFVTQALTIGLFGVIGGIIVASIVIKLLSMVYIGGDLGYFPIDFEWTEYLKGIVFGFGATFLAGYIPARKAANVDPVSIFRR